MPNYDIFLKSIENEINQPGADLEEISNKAWVWYDSLVLPFQEVQEIRRALVKILKHTDIQAPPTKRFTNLLDGRLYPSKGWITKYVKYASFCAAPLPFHFYVGVTILGAALKRDVWLPFGVNPTYGALYTILIAPPGRCFKSTAVGIGVGLLREMDVITIISGKATPQGLSDILSTTPEEEKKDAIALIAASELYTFLAGHNSPANNLIVSSLTSWYDALDEDDDITITRSNKKLYNVTISLLGGSTLEWLVESLPKHVFAGGFMSRIVFVVQEHTGEVSSISSPDDKLLRMSLLEDLRELLEKHRGPRNLTPEAFERYDTWFKMHYNNLQYSDDRHADFYQRRPDHVRKLGLILSVSNDHERIELEDVDWAIKLLDMLNPSLDTIIAPISLGESGHDLDIVRRTVEKYGEISRTNLVRKCSSRGIDSEKLNRLLQTLMDAGLIVPDNSGRKGGRIYRWLK